MAETLPMTTGPSPPLAPADAGCEIRRASGLSAASFEQLVAEHQAQVARLAQRLLGWPEDVEDVVQDVFISVFQNLASFRGESRVTTWLYRVTVNACHRQRRRRWLRVHRAETHEPVARDNAPLARREDQARVRAAVAALPSRYRDVIVLRYLEELPVAEIAEILSLSRNAIEVRLNRARNRLKGRLAGLVEGVTP